MNTQYPTNRIKGIIDSLDQVIPTAGELEILLLSESVPCDCPICVEVSTDVTE